MFMVDEDAAKAIRTAYREKGEWPAIAELRRFYKIEDNITALQAVRTIASWRPPAAPPAGAPPTPEATGPGAPRVNGRFLRRAPP